MDFIILTRSAYSDRYGRNKWDRYFHSWHNAKKVMDEEVEEYTKKSGFTLVRKLDRMNAEKGFYEYEATLEKEYSEGKATLTFAIVGGYFCD